MEHLQNLHMHCTYCDGKNTPREIAEWALLHGFESIGFSTHSYMPWSSMLMLTPEKAPEYKQEIKTLKEEYSGKLGIFCGTELEMFSEIPLDGYDYIIASTHYFKIDGKLIGFDRSRNDVEKVINDYFGGDGLAYSRAYFEQIATLPDYGKFDIIGHFDICAKHFENIPCIDVDSTIYKNSAVEAIDALRGKIPFFEVNTGGIPRGYRSIPYPSDFLIKEFKERGFGAVISSDCHDMTKMDAGFEDAAELLRACGYTERYILTDSGFTAVSL